MTPADVTAELHQWLLMITVVFAAATTLGALSPGARRSIFALIQATAFTAVVVLAAIRPTDPVDGQTGFIFPMMWVPFFVASWLGSFIGAKLASRAAADHEP